ncbi:MAG: addiction module protein [Verrucomicrobia bacterium]|nr:addiction module protein [Verrucomicrobiota bacterium]
MAEIERTILALPVEQRVRLAETLLDSLPPLSEIGSQADELAEVERREREIESGHVQPLSETEFWKQVEANRKR